MIEIANKVYYVGVNDRNKALFEGLWPLPYGVSYNSYLIDDKKVCLIDTVEVDFFVQFIENLREVLGDRQIDLTTPVRWHCCGSTTRTSRSSATRRPLT